MCVVPGAAPNRVIGRAAAYTWLILPKKTTKKEPIPITTIPGMIPMKKTGMAISSIPINVTLAKISQMIMIVFIIVPFQGYYRYTYQRILI